MEGRASVSALPLCRRQARGKRAAASALTRVSGGAVTKAARRQSNGVAHPLRLGSPARTVKSRLRRTCVAAAATAAPPSGAGATTVNSDLKRQLRQVLRLVHPDLYTTEPAAQELNSVSLQRLNAYVDALNAGQRSRCQRTELRFLVRDTNGGELREVSCTLPGGGSLSPLTTAFKQRGRGAPAPVPERRRSREPLVEWLQSNLGESVARRQQHECRASQLAAAKAALVKEHGLRHLHLGFMAESATASAAHLVAVRDALRCLTHEACAALRDVHILVADPQEMPIVGDQRGKTCVLAQDGTLWMPLSKDWRPLWRFLRSCDLAAAAAAGQATAQASADVQARLPEVAALLGVKYVFAPTALFPEPVGRFIRGILSHEAGTRRRDGGDAFRFGIHVCAEMPPGPWDVTFPKHQSPPLAAYSTGQRSVMVNIDCPPAALFQFLADHGAACDAQRAAGEDVRALLEKAQAAVNATLGAALHASVLLPEAAALASFEKLLAAAAQITDAVGLDRLRGTRIMVVSDADPCAYEVLPNGTLCIPASFKVDLLVRAILGGVATTAR